MPFLGFSSGLPLALTGGTLQAWLTVSGVDLVTIAWLSLAGLPYTLKFLWSPVMDRYAPPLGRRRGWMLITQVLLMAAAALLPWLSPSEHPLPLAALALTIAFISASQDIAFDAYRSDVLQAEERGLGAALSVAGYRIGMLVSGALALILAEYHGWFMTYSLIAALFAIGILASVWSEDPPVPAEAPATLLAAAWEPFQEFLTRQRALALLGLIVLYKLGDAFAATLSTAFLIKGLGYSLSDVGVVNKGLGLAALLVGAVCGGALMTRWSLFQSLLVFGVLQALTNLGFAALAWGGGGYPAMAAVVAFESFSGGMGTAAFVALLMALCNPRYTATQYALLSALSAVGRVLVGPTAGYLVEGLGWAIFFSLTFVSALPGLALVLWLRATLAAIGAKTHAGHEPAT